MIPSHMSAESFFRNWSSPEFPTVESLLSAIVASSDDAIISKNLEGVVTGWNPAAERIFGWTAAEIVGESLMKIFPEDRLREEPRIIEKLKRGERVEHFETVRVRKDGGEIHVELTISPVRDKEGRIVGASKIARDITQRRLTEAALERQQAKMRAVNEVGRQLVAERDVEKLVQAVTDAGRELCGADFGAFFYTVAGEEGGHFTLFTLSGAPREAFEKLGMPRRTAIFAPTFDGQGVVRVADVLADPRYGHTPPHHGMPEGHLPVRSYLAVPVVTRSGGVLGGLFFGHPEPNVFSDEAEELLVALAAQASVAIENARLYSALERDLEVQRRLESALRESEALSSAVLGSTADCIKVIDPDGTLISMNAPGLAHFGVRDVEQLRGRLWPDLWPEPMRHVIHQALEEARQGRVARFQGACEMAGGDERWWDVIISPLHSADGAVTRLTATSRDMTDLRRAEQATQAAWIEAQRQSRMKDEFFATLSHELRTPLQSILGWAQILRSDGCTPEDLELGLETISRNADAQTRIIDDLLDLNRILSGKVRLDVQRLSLAEVLEEALETVRPAAQAKEIRLQPVIDPLARPVSGDPNRLRQVFWNLLSNALKFTPRGGRIQVLLERVNSHLEVTVADNGEGIDPAFLPHVFDRFRQADATTTRRHGGLGLGLAIVKNLVELHGGNVRAKSGGPGQGAAFTIVLPLAAVVAEPEDAPREHPADGSTLAIESPLARLTGVSVLVVDDEPDARTLIARILERAGAEVRTAGSAAEALAALECTVPDVLVSDIGMPGTDGYTLIRAVRLLSRDKGGNVPALALTAYTRSEDRIKAVSAGFQTHLAKPADALELLTLVDSLARGATSRRSGGGAVPAGGVDAASAARERSTA